MQDLAKAVRLSLVGALLFSIASPAQAAGMMDDMMELRKPEMKIGLLELHPYAGVRETYDSNIFLQPRSKVRGNNANNNTSGPVLGSWITDANAGLQAKLPLSEMHQLSANYDIVGRFYTKDPRNNNTANQTAGGAYAYSHPMGLSAKLANNYVNTVDPPTSELTRRQRRWNNIASAGVEYGPEGLPFFIGLDGTHSRDKYVADDPAVRNVLDRYSVNVGGTLGYKLQPKTRVYASYHRQKIHFSRGRDAGSWSHKGDFGISGEIAPKLSGTIQTGFEYRKYDSASANVLRTSAINTQPLGTSKKITRNWTMSTAVTYKPLDRTSIVLGLSRSIQEATFSSSKYYISNLASLGASHELPFKLKVGVFGSNGLDKYAESDAIVGGVADTQTQKFTLRNRTDHTYSGGATLDYPLGEILMVGAGYTYRARFSHFYTEQFNYQDHLTSVYFSVAF